MTLCIQMTSYNTSIGESYGNDTALPNRCRAFLLQPAKKISSSVCTEVIEEGFVDYGKTVQKLGQEFLSKDTRSNPTKIEREGNMNFDNNDIAYCTDIKRSCNKEDEQQHHQKELKALSPAHDLNLSSTTPIHQDINHVNSNRPHSENEKEEDIMDDDDENIDVVGGVEDCISCRYGLYQQMSDHYPNDNVLYRNQRYFEERNWSSGKRRLSPCSSDDDSYGPSLPKRPVPRHSPPVSSPVVTSPRLEARSDIGHDKGMFTSAFNVYSRAKSVVEIKVEKNENVDDLCIRSSSADNVFKTYPTSTNCSKGLIFSNQGIEKYFPENVQRLNNVADNLNNDQQRSKLSNYFIKSCSNSPETVNEVDQRNQDNYSQNRGQFLLEHGQKLFENRLSNSGNLVDRDEIRGLGTTIKEENEIKKEVLAEDNDNHEDEILEEEGAIPEYNKKKRNKEASKQYREKRKTVIKEVFEKQRELEQKNQKLRKQLREMEQASEEMQKLFASHIKSKDMIKQEIVKLLSRSNDTTDLQSEISVMQKIFQHVANGKSSKGCVEKAIYEVLGEVIH